MLENGKHELFAQGLAQGKTAEEAYVSAGYKHDRGHASRLASKGNVQARVAELQSRVASGIVLTKQWVVERLVANAERAMQAEKPENGGEYKYDGSVANRALELLGKELGMFVDRSENVNIVHDVSSKPLTADEWAAAHGPTAH